MNKHKSKIAMGMGIVAMLISSYASAQLSNATSMTASQGARQICPAGMTVTMTHSGIRKCVGTMIREKPLQITPPKVGSQQPTEQTQQPIYIHPRFNVAPEEYRDPPEFNVAPEEYRDPPEFDGVCLIGSERPCNDEKYPNKYPNVGGVCLIGSERPCNDEKYPNKYPNDAYPCYDCGGNALPTTGTGGLERNPNFSGPGLGAGGPNGPVFGSGGSFSGPGLGAGGPNGPVFGSGGSGIGDYTSEQVQQWMQGKSPEQVAAMAAHLNLRPSQVQQAYALIGQNVSTFQINNYASSHNYKIDPNTGQFSFSSQPAAQAFIDSNVARGGGQFAENLNKFIGGRPVYLGNATSPNNPAQQLSVSQIKEWFAANPNPSPDLLGQMAARYHMTPENAAAAITIGTGAQYNPQVVRDYVNSQNKFLIENDGMISAPGARSNGLNGAPGANEPFSQYLPQYGGGSAAPRK